MECARVEIAGTFVEQRGREIGDAGLVLWILIGAAFDAELQRQHRQRVVAHEPGFDPGRRHDAFDLGRARGVGGGGNEG